MADDIVIKLNSAGVRAVLRSPEMQAELRRRAESVANAARPNAKYSDGDPIPLVVEVKEGRNRARATVFAPGGLVAEADHRFLGSALDAARG